MKDTLKEGQGKMEPPMDSPLFSSMERSEIDTIMGFLESRRVPQGECVFKEGDAGKEMFIILSGSVRATLAQDDGTIRQVCDFGSGRFFGEMAVIESAPRSATCTAMEDSQLLMLRGEDFYSLVYGHPRIALKFLSSIGTIMASWLDESSRFLNDLVRWGETARRRAVTDQLTGLYNRRFLEETLSGRFAQGAVGRRKVALLMMDLDRIHEINDRYGTAVGDRVIIAAADSFRSVLREGDISARLSGDEFAFLLPDTDVDVAVAVAERLRITVSALRIPVSAETALSIRSSLGAAVAPDHAADPETLFSVADAALRRAKELGRDRVARAE